jgi:hypothetical protein
MKFSFLVVMYSEYCYIKLLNMFSGINYLFINMPLEVVSST